MIEVRRKGEPVEEVAGQRDFRAVCSRVWGG